MLFECERNYIGWLMGGFNVYSRSISPVRRNAFWPVWLTWVGPLDWTSSSIILGLGHFDVILNLGKLDLIIMILSTVGIARLVCAKDGVWSDLIWSIFKRQCQGWSGLSRSGDTIETCMKLFRCSRLNSNKAEPFC